MPDPASTPFPGPSSTSAASSSSLFVRFLRFETMLTPMLTRFVFYIGSVLLILAGILAIYGGATARFGGGGRVLGGLGMMFAGPFLLRIACEQVLVLFGIYDRLGEIRDHNRSA